MSLPISDAEARTVEAPVEGFCDDSTSTSVEYVDLTSYIGGYVTISVETESHYVAFGPSSSFTMDVDAAAVGTSFVAMPIGTTEKLHFVVSEANPFLGYRAISGTGTIRVHKS